MVDALKKQALINLFVEYFSSQLVSAPDGDRKHFDLVKQRIIILSEPPHI
jgi:hypothetical protein